MLAMIAKEIWYLSAYQHEPPFSLVPQLTLSLASLDTAPFPLMPPKAGNSSPLEFSSRSPFDCPCPAAGAEIPGGGPGSCPGPPCDMNMPDCCACEAYDDPPPSAGNSLVSVVHQLYCPG
jgi:hypothetical protein